MSRRVLTITEAAAELGRSRDFVRNLIADKQVPARKIRGRWMITAKALDQWVDAGMPDPNPGRIVTPPGKWRDAA